MLKVTFDQASLTRLTNTLKDSAKSIGREIATAINGTSKKCSILAGRELKKEIDLPVKTLKKAVKPGIKANPKNLTTTIVLKKGYPFPLKLFLKKAGKSGKLSKKKAAANKATIGTGFIVKRYKNNIFKRATNKRGPLVLQVGPAPGDAFEKAKIAELTEKTARTELPKQVERRIRYWERKLAGTLRGNQK